jgi:hypothetical protein
VEPDFITQCFHVKDEFIKLKSLNGVIIGELGCRIAEGIENISALITENKTTNAVIDNDFIDFYQHTEKIEYRKIFECMRKVGIHRILILCESPDISRKISDSMYPHYSQAIVWFEKVLVISSIEKAGKKPK